MAVKLLLQQLSLLLLTVDDEEEVTEDTLLVMLAAVLAVVVTEDRETDLRQLDLGKEGHGGVVVFPPPKPIDADDAGGGRGGILVG